MRKGGFEPPRGCPRQPLKLVRLPFRHFRKWECSDRSELPTLANDSSTARNCPLSIWDWSGDDNRRLKPSPPSTKGNCGWNGATGTRPCTPGRSCTARRSEKAPARRPSAPPPRSPRVGTTMPPGKVRHVERELHAPCRLCRSRTGWPIVCENAGAGWLPFRMLTTQRRGIHYGTVDERTAGEAVWVQETEPIGRFGSRRVQVQRKPDAAVLVGVTEPAPRRTCFPRLGG